MTITKIENTNESVTVIFYASVGDRVLSGGVGITAIQVSWAIPMSIKISVL